MEKKLTNRMHDPEFNRGGRTVTIRKGGSHSVDPPLPKQPGKPSPTEPAETKPADDEGEK